MPVKSLTLCFAFALLCSNTIVRAESATPEAGVQSLPAVRRAAEAAVRRQIDPSMSGVVLEAGDLDSRLRLPACDTRLTGDAALPRGTQSRVLVRVGCNSNAVWTLNVPVDVHHNADVLVLKRAVARGENLAAGDVSVQSRVLPGLSSPYVSRVADLNGRLTRRAISEGAALPADALDAALLIHRGQSVTLIVNAVGLEVRAPGLALANAAAQQRVRVQNLNSLKIVEGVADSDGTVRVNP